MSYSPAEISDILELEELACRYAEHVDRRNGAALAELFVEDGLIDGSGYNARGRKVIGGIPAMLDRRYLGTFHAVNNHTIRLNGDQAEGEVYAISHHLKKADDGALVSYVMLMRYRDRYVRQADGWRFAHRHIQMDWTEDRPAAMHKPPGS